MLALPILSGLHHTCLDTGMLVRIAMDETMPPHQTSQQRPCSTLRWQTIGEAKIPTWGRNRWRTGRQFDLALIGVAGLAPSSQARCSTRLRHSYFLTKPDGLAAVGFEAQLGWREAQAIRA